ncbi:MAG: biotin-dependent carboxyltransferase family protein, partial [Actinomycetota bacterium]|nr:biotin-dependent carboxyltransferase family protein [Actinomycetota bacterium]
RSRRRGRSRAVAAPPDGAPVLFLPDHPVTGGYPVLAVVVTADRFGRGTPSGSVPAEPTDQLRAARTAE